MLHWSTGKERRRAIGFEVRTSEQDFECQRITDFVVHSYIQTG